MKKEYNSVLEQNAALSGLHHYPSPALLNAAGLIFQQDNDPK